MNGVGVQTPAADLEEAPGDRRAPESPAATNASRAAAEASPPPAATTVDLGVGRADVMLDAALAYAENGYSVFFCREKRPWSPSGRWRAATVNLGAVQSNYAAQDSHRQIGVNPQATGATLIEADPKNGMDPALMVGLLGEPHVRTSTAAAPSEKHPDSLEGVRGAHWWFSGSHDQAALQRAVRAHFGSDAIDVKSRTGGLQGNVGIVPPSVHHATGETYDGQLPPVRELEPVPAVLLDAVREASPRPEVRSEPAHSREGTLSRFETAPAADWNTTLTSLAGSLCTQMRDEGGVLAMVRNTARAWHAERGGDPIPDADLVKMVRGLWRAERAKDSDDAFETEVEQALRRSRINDEARRRLLAVEFEPLPEPQSLADLLASPLAEPEWAVAGLIDADGSTLLAAQFKSGKTTLACNLVRSLADGEPFLDSFATRLEGNVGVLNYELADRRYLGWLRHQEILRADRVRYLGLKGRPNPLGSSRGVEELTEWLKRGEVEFLLIDTYGAAFTGDNENDNSQARRFLTTLDEVKHAAGVRSLLLVAHTGRKEHGHGEEHVRGATVLDDWADSRWLLTQKADTRYLRAHGRDVDLSETDLAYEPTTRRYTTGAGVSRRQSAPSTDEEREQQVLEVVRAQPGLGKRALLGRLRGRKENNGAEVDRLVAAGQLRLQDGGHFVNDQLEAF